MSKPLKIAVLILALAQISLTTVYCCTELIPSLSFAFYYFF